MFGAIREICGPLVASAVLAAMNWVFLLSCADASADERGIFVDRTKLTCLADHANVYLALNKDPMVIFLDACPDPSPAGAAMSSGVRNSGLPQAASSAQGSATFEVSGVLILTRSQLSCLASQAAAIGRQTNGPVRLDQLPCF
jgi:hypothetical protein